MSFISPSKGRMSMKEVVEDVISFMQEDPQSQYKLIIGTDSQSREEICFVTAIIVHRLGKGARYYYQREYSTRIKSLRHKIFTETSMSLEVVTLFKEELRNTPYKNLEAEIHVDIGHNGDTKTLIREVVGWVMGSGFTVRIKPHACGASKVADRHTK